MNCISPLASPLSTSAAPRRIALLACCVLLSGLAAATADAADAFQFQPNDTVAIFGNGLADRMQHDPWVETVLQKPAEGHERPFPQHELCGDMVNKRPRNKGFTNDDEYLQHVAPDVVFAFYGYNESYAGPGGAAAYRGELVKLVDSYTPTARARQGKEVRFVLFSPIAYENTGRPASSRWRSAQCESGRLHRGDPAGRRGDWRDFVDLYTPTRQLFASSSERYTLNGIHLNAAGYQELAGIISEAMLGKPAPAAGRTRGVYMPQWKTRTGTGTTAIARPMETTSGAVARRSPSWTARAMPTF